MPALNASERAHISGLKNKIVFPRINIHLGSTPTQHTALTPLIKSTTHIVAGEGYRLFFPVLNIRQASELELLTKIYHKLVSTDPRTASVQ